MSNASAYTPFMGESIDRLGWWLLTEVRHPADAGVLIDVATTMIHGVMPNQRNLSRMRDAIERHPRRADLLARLGPMFRVLDGQPQAAEPAGGGETTQAS